MLPQQQRSRGRVHLNNASPPIPQQPLVKEQQSFSIIHLLSPLILLSALPFFISFCIWLFQK